MSCEVEVALTSDESGGQVNACMWDINTGTILSTFKGGVSCPRTLCLIDQDYLLSANKKEPYIQVWSLAPSDPFYTRMISPGLVNSLAVCPDGVYCVAGIGEKIHIWQVCTGDLLVASSYHYQPITCLKFTDDGSHFVSAGKDGLVLVWDLSRILSNSALLRSSSQPRHVWSNHSFEVTDVHIGFGGIKARVATCSLDQTCKLYELGSGVLLLSIIMNVSLTSLTMDSAEYFLFLGTVTGNIYEINLYPSFASHEIHPEEEEMQVFTGHSGKVTCLTVSMDGQLLFSGSEDNSARIWQIQSRHCVRALPHRGSVTNALLVRMPSDDGSKLGRLLPINPFKKSLYGTNEQENKEKQSVEVRIQSHELSKLHRDKNFGNPACNAQQCRNAEASEELQSEMEKLHLINHQLYVYSVNSVLNNIE